MKLLVVGFFEIQLFCCELMYENIFNIKPTFWSRFVKYNLIFCFVLFHHEDKEQILVNQNNIFTIWFCDIRQDIIFQDLV